MSSMTSARNPEISEDLGFQRRQWAAAQLGFYGILAIMALALLGLFGGAGPLSDTTSESQDGHLQVEHQRFGHLERQTYLTIHAAPTTGNMLRVWISEDYLKNV